jgi:hypothetical protein
MTLADLRKLVWMAVLVTLRKSPPSVPMKTMTVKEMQPAGETDVVDAYDTGDVNEAGASTRNAAGGIKRVEDAGAENADAEGADKDDGADGEEDRTAATRTPMTTTIARTTKNVVAHTPMMKRPPTILGLPRLQRPMCGGCGGRAGALAQTCTP